MRSVGVRFCLWYKVRLLEADHVRFQLIMSAKVSIIVPVHNAAQYLRRCLESVLAQSFDNYECICVNDASSDSSLKVLREYSEKDSRFIVIDGVFGGPSATRNVALAEAQGDYIAFLDADDWWEQDMLEKVVARAIDAQADMVIFDYWLAYENGNKLDTYRDQNMFARLDGMVVDMASRPELAGFVGIWDRLFRRDVLVPHGFMVDRLYEDAIYSVEATVAAQRIAIMADHLYYYRRNVEHSITYDEDASRKHEEDFLIAQGYIQDVYRKAGISIEAWTEYARYFAEYAYMHQREVRPRERFYAFFDVVRDMACPKDGPQLFELWHDDPHRWRNVYLGFVRNNQPELAWAEAKVLNAAGRVLGRR